MPAYIIVRAEITDWEAYHRYTQISPQVVARYGGRFLARGGSVVTLEGPQETNRIVILEFPSLEEAVRFYESPEYSEARKIRAGAAKAQFIAVEGVPS
jgi:uncharacterized protein (DUF1330 family)